MATVEIQYDEETDEYFIELPEHLIDQVKWEIGDEITWTQISEGTWELRKTDES